MNATVPRRALTRVAGIPVTAHWSTGLIAGLVWYVLATSILPGTGEPTDAALALLAVLGTAAFLGSILAHELAHAVVARRVGLGVRSIGLELLGGFAQLERQPWRPRQQLLVSAAGPAASIGLGAAGLGLAALLVGLGAPEPLHVLALWLGGANLVLGVFNLLPGLPLDGGRILQGLLWWRNGHEARATVTAARAGRVVGIGLVGFGLAGLFGATPGGLWTMLLGWFVLYAARAEQAAAETTIAFAGIRVADVMSSPVIVVQDHRTVAELAVAAAGPGGRSSYPVQAFSGRIDGLIALEQLRLPAGQDPTDVAVRQRMTPAADLLWASPEEPLVDVLRRAPVTAGGRILVGDPGELLGIVTPTDLRRLSRRRALTAGTAPQGEPHPAPGTAA